MAGVDADAEAGAVLDFVDEVLQVLEAVAKVGLPWYNVLGNHDLNFDALDNTQSVGRNTAGTIKINGGAEKK